MWQALTRLRVEGDWGTEKAWLSGTWPPRQEPDILQRSTSNFKIQTVTYLTFMHSLVPLCPPSWKTEYKYGTTGRPLGFSGDSEVKNLPAMHETWVQSLGQEDTLEKEMPIINTGLLKRDEILLGKCLSGIFILGRKMRSLFDQMCPEI